jgi:hypothetical protein
MTNTVQQIIYLIYVLLMSLMPKNDVRTHIFFTPCPQNFDTTASQ